MVETKLVTLALAVSLALSSCSPGGVCWEALPVDGHLTGATSPTADNVPEALGTLSEGVYTAPSGASFRKGSATAAVAGLMVGVQPEMARIKEVIAWSGAEMVKHRPECELANFAVDIVYNETARLTGRKVDVAILNLGGIRTSMPAGPVILDDILSMFPFKNDLVYVVTPGRELRRTFEFMADGHIQAVSGAKLVIRDGRLVSAEIGGKPLDDNKFYGLATLDFLLDGGDGFNLARDCRELVFTGVRMIEAVEPVVRGYGQRGDTLKYFTDGRIVVENQEEGK